MANTQVDSIAVGLLSTIVITASMMFDMEAAILSLLVLLILPSPLVSEENKLCVLTLIYVGTANLPLNTLVLLAWPVLIRHSRTFQTRNMYFIYYTIGFFLYSLVILFLTYDQIRIPVGALFLRNTIKELLYPFLMILVYANFSGGIKSLYLVMWRVAVTMVAIGVMLLAFGYEGDVSLFEQAYPIAYVMPAVFLFNRSVRLLSIVSLLAFAIITLHFGLYISSGFVVMAAVSLAGSCVIGSHNNIAKVVAIIAAIVVAGIDYNDLLEVGVPPSLAFKLSLPNTGARILTSGGDVLYDMPWTLAVRIVETRNVIGDGPLTVLFGKGAYSVVGETVTSYESATGRTFGDSDYTAEEEDEGQYYTLHNTSRGLLHYGIIYFIVSIALFLKCKGQIDRDDPSFHVKMYMAVLFLMQSLWNPYVSSLYLQYWLLARSKNE